MTAKQQAIEDIKEDLRKEKKSFLAFRTSLNPTIGNIVRKYINKQINVKH